MYDYNWEKKAIAEIIAIMPTTIISSNNEKNQGHFCDFLISIPCSNSPINFRGF
jgi:hypothetical protein